MPSRPGKQTVTIHILPSIARSTDSQIIKYSQLIKHNTRNIFFEKSYTKYGGKTIFLKTKIEYIFQSIV